MDQRIQTGRIGEQYAKSVMVEQLGWTIIESNWRCRIGEMDFIAMDGDCLVFVEVRSRKLSSVNRFGTPEHSIDYRKQQRVRRIAEMYLLSHPNFASKPVRFDCFAVYIDSKTEEVQRCNHVRNAF